VCNGDPFTDPFARALEHLRGDIDAEDRKSMLRQTQGNHAGSYAYLENRAFGNQPRRDESSEPSAAFHAAARFAVFVCHPIEALHASARASAPAPTIPESGPRPASTTGGTSRQCRPITSSAMRA